MAKKATTRWFLKQWRKHRSYTQERLAEMVGLSKPYLSQLERGDRQYTQELLERFAEALQCEPADLIIRDPSDPDGIWSVWDQLRPNERNQVVEIAKTIKRTGTEG
jgi:transcriptional regulator with XRE-family HTH domain